MYAIPCLGCSSRSRTADCDIDHGDQRQRFAVFAGEFRFELLGADDFLDLAGEIVMARIFATFSIFTSPRYAKGLAS
ncbi:hypothetical protein A4R29_30710 (plasmid) [Mesorhizobium ciceri biovar biserrulae]|nr:hypothetical protein A4R29_30710 [Mesorhizobium ciceri biovar biserrulae]